MENFKQFSEKRLLDQATKLGISVPKKQLEKLPALLFGKKGYATLEQNGVFLHSKHDPVKEAERQLSSLDIPDAHSLVFFFGAGLGYSLELFLKKYKNPVVWIEPKNDVLLLALGLFDLRFALADERIKLLSPLAKKHRLQNEHISDETMEKICKGFNASAIVFFNHPASFRSSRVFLKLKERVEAWLNKKSVNQATLARFDRLWMHNLLRNFPKLLLARPIKELFGKFHEKEAIVCGAGPSLSQDIALLHKLREGRILIAVDTAYHVLLAHRLVPDFVVCVDPQAINQYYLESPGRTHIPSAAQLQSRDMEKAFAKIHFVVDPTVSYLCLRHIPEGQLFYFESPFAMFQLFSRFLEDGAGEIAYGGSVSTNAYDLAIKLGCKNILLFGQDLSFPDKKAHASGATLEARLLWKENRFFRHEEHNYRQLSALPVRYLPGLDGQKVPTNDKLLIFHQWFEGRFSKDNKNIEIADLKSQGARFFALDANEAKKYKHSYHKSPQNTKAGKPKATAPTPRPSKTPPTTTSPSKKMIAAFSKTQLKGFTKTLARLKAELEELRQLCLTGKKLAQECLEGQREGAAYAGKLKSLDQIDGQIRKLQFGSQVAGSAMQRILLSITENFASQLSQEERTNPHLKSAKESLLLYEGLNDTSEEIAEWLQKTLFLIHQEEEKINEII